jgi:MFS family permease
MVILSFVSLASALVGPFVGHRIDKGGGRQWCWVAILLNGLGVGTLALAGSLSILIVALGLVSYFVSVTIAAVISSIVIEGYVSASLRQKTSSYWAVAGNAGLVVSGIIAFYFIAEYQTELLLIDFVTTSLFIVYLAGQLKGERGSEARAPQAYFRGAGKAIFLNPILSTVAVAIFLSLYFQMYVFPVLFKINGLRFDELTPLVGTLNSAVVIGVGLLVGRGAILNGLNSKIIVFFLATIAGFFLMPFFRSEISILLVTGIWSIGEILIYPITAHLAYTSIAPEGLAAAVKTIWIRSAQTIAPLFAIAVSNTHDSHSQAWILVAPLILGLALLIANRAGIRSK